MVYRPWKRGTTPLTTALAKKRCLLSRALYVDRAGIGVPPFPHDCTPGIGIYPVRTRVYPVHDQEQNKNGRRSHERVHQIRLQYQFVVVPTKGFTRCFMDPSWSAGKCPPETSYRTNSVWNKQEIRRLTDASVCQRKKKWQAGISSGGLPPVPGQLLAWPSFPPEYLPFPYISEAE